MTIMLCNVGVRLLISVVLIVVRTVQTMFLFSVFFMLPIRENVYPDSRNRRHAWDFPAVKSDGFKLGKLLDRDRKRGFEKLNQDGSDEESNSSTNALLSNAQFA